MKIMVQIDGAYLERMLSEEHGSPAIDYSKLATKLVNTVITTSEADLYLLRTYYYHALPWIGKNPNEQELEMFKKKQGFFTRLEHLPRFDVYLGRTQRILNDDGTYTYQQKGVDVLLAAQMIGMAAKGAMSHLILLAPDGDYVPAVRATKEYGVVVHLAHGQKPQASSELIKSADERIVLSSEFLVDCMRSVY
ncbi:MAG: NYN domain-containing protein [candidate division Zixibacteria bacterium]|nr:NYN domain-containing protein [candidate division Zixibacteria bacterium]